MFTRLLLMGLLCLAVPAQSATLFSTNSTWRFLRGTNEASRPDVTAWRNAGFNDASFADAPAPFWYGDVRPGGTQLADMLNNYTCIFLRKTFVVNNASQIGGLRLTYYIDDGFVAWINGQPVFNENVADPAPTTNTLASGQAIDPAPFTSMVNGSIAGVLQEGVNTIAIQVFNTSAGSSDLGFDCQLESIISETIPPVITSVTPTPGSTVGSLTQVTVTFSEPVAGVTADDLLIQTQPAASVSGSGTTYTFTFAQPPYGAVGFTWFPAHGITDEAVPPNPFDGNGANATWQYTFLDTVPPVVANLFPLEGVTVRALSQIEVTFSEEVSGVQAADLLVNNQPATSIARAPGGPYVFQFAQPVAGTVNVRWASGHGITDQAGAPNSFTGGSWTYELDPNAGAGDLVLTEFLASNQTGLQDEDGQEQDWIEIYNRGATAADLAGWSLSNEPDEPGRWVFPARILPPGQYLVVFASGKDLKNPTGTNRLHTSFQLSSGGEFLGLYDADSPRRLISGIAGYPEQRNDHSYGVDSSGNLRYFAAPTPGGPNGISTITGVVDPVHFSVARGHYTQPFDLVLTCSTPGATIRYRTDGVEPAATTGLPYISPLRVTNTTLLRVAAFRANLLPSRTETHSYFFNLTAAQRSMPVLSIITGVSNLIGRSGIIGMNVSATNRSGDGAFLVETATEYHNPSKHGLAWERPVSAEYILPADNSGFQIDCGIRVQGSDWQRPRTTPASKFSFRLYFRGDYGEGRLEYPLFPLTQVQSFDQLVLRAGYNDNSNPFIRDETVRRLSHDMGEVAAHGGFTLIFTNGGYAGYYNPTERVHEEFMQSHAGGGSEWDVVCPDFAQSSEGPGVVDGDRNNFNSLLNYVWTQQTPTTITNPAIYREVARRLDLANFADYCLLNAYAAMGDWPANNWRAARERSTNGIWRFIAWDCEWGNGFDAHVVATDSFALSGTGTLDAGLNSTGNSEIARLYQRLRANPEFRLLWADRIQKHFFNGGALTTINVSNRLEEMRRDMQPVITITDTEFLNWGRDRLPPLFAQFNTYGLYGFSNALYGIFASSNAPTFNQHGGPVAPGFTLTMSAPLPGSLIYYTTNGDDPRVMFTGAVSNSAAAYSGPITLSQSMRVRARSLWQGTNWSALNQADFNVAALGIPLRLTELNYNPTNAAHEFLEIQNVGGAAVDLSGMNFEGITFTFNVGTSLAPGARLVLVSDFGPAEFAARYPGVAVFGYYSGNLNNGGERIALKDRNGNYIFTVDYDDGGGWPIAADGGGRSLEITDPFGDPDDPANWHGSTAPGGSPGAVNPSGPLGFVRLNEMLAENGGVVNHNGTFPDYVEIRNTGVTPIDLNNWSLTDEGSNPRKFIFPSTALPAGGYLVVWCDDATNTTPGLHAGFSLQRGGDNVQLYNASSNLVDALIFGPQVPGQSVGSFGGQWVLNTPTPGADNAAAPVAAASSLSINEWQASAPPGQSDWIELYNAADRPVALRGCYLSNTSTVHRITSLSFVPAFGFAQLFADEAVGPDHLDFRLAAAGGTIVLFDSLAAEVNRVSYTNAVEGLTRGRLPDGATTIVNFPGSASPGASNYVNTYAGAVLNEVLARNRSAVTNGGNAADYLELFNPNGTAFPLLGMSLSVNSAEPGQYIFPASASVPANGYLVIWCDGSRPASITPGDYNTGRSLDGESGGAYLFNAQGQVVNNVEYGFQVSDRPIGISGGQWRLLASATPGAANAAPAALGTNAVLRFNEWMANPLSGPDWFELFNPTNLPVELAGLFLTDDPSNAGQRQFRVAPLSFIEPEGFVQWIADGEADQGRDHVNFSLDAAGESLWLFRSPTGTNNFTLIDTVAFDTQQLNLSEGRLPDGRTNIVSFPGSATPAESNYRPVPGVVINEVLSHAAPPLEDAVELRNTSVGAVSIGGWYLSNSQDDFKKYRIPDGTSIAGGGFAVIYQNQFSNGSPTSFTFDSAHGDKAWLSEADAAGNLTGHRTGAKFGAALNGVSFGRVVTSVGTDYTPMWKRTFGMDTPATLAQFRTGTGLSNSVWMFEPVAITEIMYNPPPGAEEYVELYFNSDTATPLYDPAFPGNRWRLSGGIEYIFPPNITMPAGGRLLVVDFDPVADPAALATFRARYGIAVNVPVFGPFLGKLNNGGDIVEVLRADTPQQPPSSDAGFVPYVRLDRVDYSDAAPWPSGAVDGGGLSLQRQGNTSYGNEPLNWRASTPTPGAANGAGIVPAPVITLSPQSQSVVEGDASALAVTASGAVPIGYQWRFNGTPLPNATNAAFALDYVVLDNEGDYDCIVSNPGGAALSAAARLGVMAPAVVFIPPTSLTNRAGSNVVFTVGVRGSAPLRYQWRLNGVTLPGETNATITRTNIQFADDGEYDVVVSNPVNATMASARLTVLINPVIVRPPVSATVVEGSDFTLSAEVTGNPVPFAFSWRRGSIVIATNSGNYRSNFVTLNTTAAGLLLTNNMLSSNYQMRLVVYNLANSAPGVLVTFTNTVLADFDRDGIPDVVENELGLSPTNPADAALDGDGDGMSNRAEYAAGTDPTSNLSYLRINQGPGATTVSVAAVSNRTYTVQFTDNVNSGVWSRMADIVARANNRVESFTDPTWTTNRFYRVVTPRQP